MGWSSEGQRKQLTVWSVSQSEATIDRLRGSITKTNFDRHRTDSDPLAEFADLEQGCRAQPFIATLRDNEEIVDGCHHSSIFHSESERHHDVTDVLVFLVNEPHVAKAFIGNDLGKCRTSNAVIEIIARLSVERGHQHE